MGTREFDAATLSAPAGVNLRFYDYGKSELPSRCLGLLDGAGNPAPWDFDIEPAQQFLRLILVKLHI
jgi:hypothetical protein